MFLWSLRFRTRHAIRLHLGLGKIIWFALFICCYIMHRLFVFTACLAHNPLLEAQLDRLSQSDWLYYNTSIDTSSARDWDYITCVVQLCRLFSTSEEVLFLLLHWFYFIFSILMDIVLSEWNCYCYSQYLNLWWEIIILRGIMANHIWWREEKSISLSVPLCHFELMLLEGCPLDFVVVVQSADRDGDFNTNEPYRQCPNHETHYPL